MFNEQRLYLCDPLKNTMCSKSNCFLYGGSCEHTTNRNYRTEPEGMEKLEHMLDMQQTFQERLGAHFNSMTPKDRVAFIKEHSIHLNQEINEMLYELPYFKPWKDYSGVTEVEAQAAFEKARMECIDAWHFFMNIMLALGFSPDVFYEMYLAKNKENHRRQDEGYTADKSYKDQTVEEVMHNG